MTPLASSALGNKETTPSLTSRKSLHPVRRALLIGVGTVFVAIGVVGIYLPILPTTPFLLLALACYARSSERLYHWLVSRPRLGSHLSAFLEKKALPRRVKVISLGIAWAVLGGLAFFAVESALLQGLLIALALAKTIVLLAIPTLDQQEEE